MNATDFRVFLKTVPEDTLRAVIRAKMPNSYDNPMRPPSNLIIWWVMKAGSKHPVDKARRRNHILYGIQELSR